MLSAVKAVVRARTCWEHLLGAPAGSTCWEWGGQRTAARLALPGWARSCLAELISCLETP